jgi:signal transduction histidine kinase
MDRPLALTRSLEAKILLSIGASLLLGFGVLLALNIRHGTQELLRQGMEKSTLLAAAVIKGIQHNMVQGRADIARRLVEDLKTIPNLVDLHIYRRDGTLAFQDLETLHQVEALLDRQRDEGTLAALKVIEEGIRTFHSHFERPTWTADPARIEQVVRTGQPLHFDATIAGQGRYVQLTPLPNEPRCHRCHGADHAVRGVLLVATSTEPMQADIRRTRLYFALTSTITVAVVLLLLRTLIRRVILTRLTQVVSAMRAIAGGDLSRTLEVNATDEIGELAKHVNLMTEGLKSCQVRLLQAERLAALGELSAAVAHGLINPLAGIRAAAQLAREDARAGADVAEALDEVIAEVDRLDRRVKDLLDFSRPFEPRLEPVHASQVIQRAAALMEPGMREANVRLDLQLAPNLPQVWWDAEQMEEVLVALLANAVDAMPGGGTLTVHGRLIAEAEGVDCLGIEIEDTGRGIRAEDLPRVFDLFFTSKPGGTGLGLPLARKVVEKHGGRIAIESAPGEGTTVRLLFPCLDLAPPGVSHGLPPLVASNKRGR